VAFGFLGFAMTGRESILRRQKYLIMVERLLAAVAGFKNTKISKGGARQGGGAVTASRQRALSLGSRRHRARRRRRSTPSRCRWVGRKILANA
jgi:hypothetical protein